MKSELEEKLKDTYVSITSKCLYYPCESGRDKVEYPDHVWLNDKVILIPISDKSYNTVAENLYFALTNIKKPLNDLSNKERRLLYNTITNNPMYDCIRKQRL